MSVKDGAQIKATGREIPTRKMVLNDVSQLPHDYSSTPGGTIFSTTPGGTRILYERSFLLQCRNSPLTKSPPPNMAKIPGITSPGQVEVPHDKFEEKEEVENKEPTSEGRNPEEPAQFQMDI